MAEGLIALLEIFLLPGTQFAEFIPDQGGHFEAVDGVRQVVGIAEGMDVAHGTVNGAGGDTHGVDYRGGVQVTSGPLQDLAVGGVLQEHRGPAHFQFQAYLDIQVSLAQFLDQTGLGFDKVGVFRPLGEDVTATWLPPISRTRLPNSGTVAQTFRGFPALLALDRRTIGVKMTATPRAQSHQRVCYKFSIHSELLS